MNCMYRTLLSAVALAFSSVAASADTITVCASGCDYTSINAAIGAASDGDILELAAETYFEGEQIDTLGKAITLRGVLDKAGEPSSVLDGAETHRVLICQSGETNATSFENLVIQNGYGQLEEVYLGQIVRTGGGMYNESCSPTLTSCTFTSNSAGFGGGMFNGEYSSPTLTGCAFTSNSASYGGGMCNFVSSPTLFDCTFTGNSALNWGGGIANGYHGSSPTLTECMFTSNSANRGGGIRNFYGGIASLADCTLCGNDTDNIFGTFTNLGGNCLAYSCDDSDGDGTPDKCAADGLATLRVPSQYARIEDAVEAAGYGDVVLVEAGVYFPSRTINTGGKPITIRGAVDSTGQPATIIDGRGNIRLLECTSGESADTVFENLLIQNGYDKAGQTLGGERGSGMYNNSSSPTLTNCTFTGNSAFDGGGMYNDSSSPNLTDCTFTENSAENEGGGMYNISSSPTLTDCTFADNSADQAGQGQGDERGGGMFNFASSPILTNCTFTGNSADDEDGGGMYNYFSSTPTLNECTFTDNSANDGGGMYNDGSSPILTNCTFTGNSAEYGGGMFNSENTPTLTNCTFTDNSGTRYGGGMYNTESSSPSLAECEFTSNSAGYGGGMANYSSSTPALNECTFTSNLAYRGGGMYNTESSSPSLTECTFTECCQIDPPRSIVDGGGNDYDSWCDDCRADVNCLDDAVNAADLGILIGSWGTNDPQCDINGDGTVSAADLGLLIGAWGPCQ